ncbi:hypothetical protein F4778DRAFT_793199 [Xylariomycetidae sp. FL2044]|nr:hypothetical protein F4778DRAFT_793199 [Xylariomycetidae sp. FL2044]
MWDRLRQKDGGAPLNRKKLEAWQNSRSSSASSPTTSTGVQGGTYQYQYAIKAGPPPQRPPREFENQQQAAYAQAPPPSARNSHRNSASYGRPVSSVYSQPSPEAATFAARQLRNEVAYTDPNDISPPSSPDISSPKYDPNPGDVSPIDEAPDMSQLAASHRGPSNTDPRPSATNRAPQSSIPTMRRERRRNSDAVANALRKSQSREQIKPPRPYGHDVRWDPRTGEPTTSNKGRPSQVNPQEYVQGLGTRAASASPQQQLKQTPQNSSPFGERIRRTREPSGSPQPEPAPRPQWRGASGRTTLVAPVNDNQHVAPLNVPPKSTRRTGRGPGGLTPVSSIESETVSPAAPRGPGSERNTESPGAGTTKKTVPNGRQPQAVSINTASAAASSLKHPAAYPSPPLSDDNSVPAKPTPAIQTQTQPGPSSPRSLHPLQIPSNEKTIRRKPAGSPATATPKTREQDQSQKSTSSPAYSQIHDIHPAHAPPGGFPDDWTQPPSRFSVTTYATSRNTTPRESVDEAAPPVPTPPQQQLQDPPANSILNRKRPVIPGFEESSGRSSRNSPVEAVRINMESSYYTTSPSAMSPSTGGAGNSSSKTKTRPAVSSTADKVLPPAPPEVTAATQVDRVAQLNARLEALGNRRINIHTAIKQMTELMPTDNILASDAVVRKREAEKRKVEVLRAELADVERESYELGLKLHRAYKRLDREAEYEPTTLWVRRVTG